jgi:hypothetical protein
MSFLSKALTLDRRWIFLAIGVVVYMREGRRVVASYSGSSNNCQASLKGAQAQCGLHVISSF